MSLPNDPVSSSVQPPARPPARPARRRALLIGGISVVLLAAAWAGSTAYAAGQAEQVSTNLARTIDTTLKSRQFGQVERHTFTRGLTESTDDMYIVLGDGADAARLHLRNHIHNGPFPGMSQVGQAAVDTEIIWDAKTQALLDKAFAGQKPTLHTLITLGGATDTTVRIPSGQYHTPDSLLTWQALAGEFKVSDAGRSVSGRATWPGGKISTSEGTATLNAVRYVIDQRPYLKRLSQGTSQFTVASVELPAGVGTLSDLKITTDTAPKGANLEGRTTFTASRLSLEDQRFNNLRLAMGASGLNSSALERLVDVTQSPEYQNALKGSENETPDQTFTTLMTDLKPVLHTLLAGNPRLAVNELSVQTPQGPLKLALAAQVVNGASIPLDSLLSDDTLKAGVENPALLSLMGNVKLTADIAGTQAAITGLLGSSGDETAQGIAQSLDPMVQEGMITKKGEMLSTHLEFSKDGLIVNGKPLPM